MIKIGCLTLECLFLRSLGAGEPRLEANLLVTSTPYPVRTLSRILAAACVVVSLPLVLLGIAWFPAVVRLVESSRLLHATGTPRFHDGAQTHVHQMRITTALNCDLFGLGRPKTFGPSAGCTAHRTQKPVLTSAASPQRRLVRPAVRQDMRRTVLGPVLVREPLLERHQPLAKGFARGESLGLLAAVWMDDDRDIFGCLVVVAGLDTEQRTFPFVEPDHRSTLAEKITVTVTLDERRNGRSPQPARVK